MTGEAARGDGAHCSGTGGTELGKPPERSMSAAVRMRRVEGEPINAAGSPLGTLMPGAERLFGSSTNGDGFEPQAGASSGSARGSTAVAGGSSVTDLIESDSCVVAGGGGAAPLLCEPDLTTEAQPPLDGAAVGTKSGPQRICRCCFD